MGNKAVCITHETTRKCGNKVARDRCVFIARCQSSGHLCVLRMNNNLPINLFDKRLPDILARCFSVARGLVPRWAAKQP